MTAATPPPTSPSWTSGNQRIEIATTTGMGALASGIVERWLTPGFRENNPAETERITKMVLATPPLGYAACCAAIRDMDQREAIKGITVPTLVVAGEKNPATPPENGRTIHDLIKGLKFVLLDAAHLSNIERTDAFNRAVLEFLTRSRSYIFG